MPINLTVMAVKLQTWIKIAEPTLISVLIKGGSLLFQLIPPFKIHISCHQFLISMFSLGMSIGKKHYALMKAWATVLNAIQIIILHVTMWQPKINMINSYNKYKVESLKAKRYILQSLNPTHFSKKKSQLPL